MSLADVFGELEVGGFFRFRLTGDAEQIFRFRDDEEVGVFKKDLNPGREICLGRGKAIRANSDRIADGKRMIELGDRSAVDRHGLKLEPSPDLFLFLLRPLSEHLFQQGARLRNGERLWHEGSLEEKRTDGNVWRLVMRRGAGILQGCAFFF